MHTLTPKLLYLLMSFSVATAVTAGEWSTGWGQGTSEYIAEVDAKNGLNIACNDVEPVKMMATVNGKQYGSYASESFDLIIDGFRYSTPYETGSRLGANNFSSMWNELRQAKTITLVTEDGQTLSLPTTGAADALPATNSREYDCIMELGVDNSTETQSPPDTPQTSPLSEDELGTRIYRDEYGRLTLEVLSKTDRLVITGVKINRGNCSTLKETYPQKLAFGQSHHFYIIPNACHILEVALSTDRGLAEFSFD